MNRSKYFSVSFAIVVGVLSGIGSGLPTRLQADDTEIYLGAASVSAGIRPNVLMILDTSGSMSGTVSGTGMDRMDNMKVAMKKIIDGVNNVNIGLMRFSDPGGPILYPVSYVDKDVSEVTTDPNSADVNVRISQGIDDAEQIDCRVTPILELWDCPGTANLGKVSLDSPVLDKVRTVGAPSAGGNSFETQVDTDTDDGEQDIGGSQGVSLGSSDVELAYDGGLQVAGMRFRNVAIPQGATILSAELEFVADESDSAIGFTLRIQGEATDDANTYTTVDGNITSRPTTTSFTDWMDPEPWTADDIYKTPDITAIVQEIINRPGWVPDNDMALTIQYAPGSATGDSLKRVAYTHNRDSDRAPRLRIDWTTEKTDPENQWVGLRFNGVGIPQGATIESAHIEFVPTQDDAGELEVEIMAYDIDNMPEFTNAYFGLTSGVPTTMGITTETWTPDPWTAGVSAQTVDIKNLVQHVVDRAGWCGNNSMGFLMGLKDSNTKHGPRVGYSFDSNPTNAPILRISYDETSAPSGCIDQWVQRQIQAQPDDAEEVVAAGTVDLGSTDLDFDSAKISGMRFTDIPVTKGQKILEARLVFTADADQSGATTLRFRGEKGADAATFADVKNDLAKRAKTTASVDWVAPDHTQGVQYTSPDLAPIVQEIVNGAGWLPGNALAIFEEYVSGGARNEVTWDRDKLKAPTLMLKVQGALATTGAGQRTVRTVLKEIVDGLDHNGHTPIVDTLYEAALYYAGQDVLYGAHRGWDRDSTYQPNPNAGSSNPKVRRNTRVSHPGSWGGGGTSIDQPGDCSDDDLNHDDCIYERIKGNPTYKSPIESNCQSNFIILLTDGIANHNHSEDAIRTYTGEATCAGGNGEQACGHELVKYLHDEDQSPVAGMQNVITYTIGFNFSSKWLVEMAALGGGKFHEAKDADQLVREVTNIFTDILNRSTSFAAPTLSVNAFNKLFHRSDVYFSLFKPSASVRWEGNLKKYQLCPSTGSDSTLWPKDKSGTPKACADLGEVLDAEADPAVVKDPLNPDLGRIEDTAESFWGGVQDGSEIKVGGAGLEIPAPANRRVLTYTSTAAPSFSALDNVTHTVASAGGGDQGILKGLSGTKAEREKRTQVLFGDLAFASTPDDREEIIDWMIGTDIDGLEDVASLASAGRRFAFHDPLHSSAVAVTFGGTEDDPMIKLFVGTNDGGLRAVNATNGVEEWIFYPQATLARQKELRDNFAGTHIYGLDGTPSVWMNDRNGNGIIEAGSDLDSNGYIEEDEGDFVRLIIGMRRGGRNVYAVDVTPGTPQSTAYTATAGQQTNDIPPTYMWRIEGGAGNFSSLGQTWSKPQITKMRFGDGNTPSVAAKRSVMVMSGGYDDFQDSVFGSGGNGNSIYFVNPYTGAMEFVISGTDHGISNQLIVPDMVYPIPSDLSMMDTNGDGSTDRIYVGDTGGQLWRIDVEPDLTDGSSSIKPVVGKLASISNDIDPLDRRKLFYPPDVVRVHDGAIPGVAAHDLVVLTTGNRSHPLDETVQDRIYAFRDMYLYGMTDADSDGLADSYTTLQGQLVDPSLAGDLMDVTDIVDFTVTANMDDLKAADGWFIDLEGVGEKGLAAPVVLDGKIFFTTYVPEKVIDPTNCSIQEGVGKLYAVDVLDGSAVQNWDGVGDDTNLTKSDRTYGLGSGIPSQAVPIFQPEGITLLIGGGGGATSVNPNIALPRVPTYWAQEE